MNLGKILSRTTLVSNVGFRFENEKGDQTLNCGPKEEVQGTKRAFVALGSADYAKYKTHYRDKNDVTLGTFLPIAVCFC